ncbi:NADP-dependent oxidoreductase domain-containing protein [Suillus bovinus]|uniref:NADP-dependent oxidoreductase domain-containing protein n=1 Tax=Suillus bovinus TaxID=48563 RepID=UPI001B861D4C|nr:NADP-dependent oxidoreductase domain-containing protein [Suillus bovinus]KAG2156625.1 NADP-dependent oxidoreductase domain-containing protein [Suillus bovinus]
MASIVLKRTQQKVSDTRFVAVQVTKSTCADTVYNAIKAGYRLLDGAGDYGNEKEAGEGVRRAIADGLVKREDLCDSRLWNTFHARDHVKQATKMQLGLWGIDYFDLFLIHFPIALKYVDPSHRYPPEWFGDDGKVYTQNTPMHETWGAMEELVDEKLVKNIGLSNCQGSLILDVLRYAKYEPQVLQVELHPYLSQEALVKLCKTFSIAVTAYSSFGPQSYVELGIDRDTPSLLQHDVTSAVAKTHGKSAAQVLLRWATQRGIAVIPKSNNFSRLSENLDCNSFDLSESELAALSALNINLRLNDPADIDSRLAIFA